MTAATRHQAAVLRLTQDAIALARQLPGTPSRIRLRDGSTEIEIEWAASAVAEPESVPEPIPAIESGKHRRPSDPQPDNPPFLKLAAHRL